MLLLMLRTTLKNIFFTLIVSEKNSGRVLATFFEKKVGPRPRKSHLGPALSNNLILSLFLWFAKKEYANLKTKFQIKAVIK